MFYVVKVAVYEHGIFGIFNTKAEAVAQAKLAASKDRDDHHDWCVCEHKQPDETTDYKQDNDDKVWFTVKHSETIN